MKSGILFLTISLGFFLVGCSTQQKSVQSRPKENIPRVTPSPYTDPLLEPTSYKELKNFQKTWQNFIRGGRFRIARTEETGGKPFHFGWHDDVLVIVVDSSEPENHRLKLAYFKASQSKNENYQLYWVAHSCELAKSYLGNASSDLVVSENPGRSCFIKWDRAQKEYVCRCQT